MRQFVVLITSSHEWPLDAFVILPIFTFSHSKTVLDGSSH